MRILEQPSLFKVKRALLDIEKKLQSPIDERSCKKLFKKLESLQRSCLKIQASLDLSEKIRHLFGRVLSLYVDSEVAQIACSCSLLKEGDLTKASFLKEKINSLKQYHRLSKDHLSQIITAEKIISMTMKSFSPFPELFENDPLPDEAEILLEIAEEVYDNNLKSIPSLYQSLSPQAQSRLDRHLNFLQTTSRKNKTLQALFASAFELAGIQLRSYPSTQEIQSFFLEKRKVCQQETTGNSQKIQALFIQSNCFEK